ncbi:MAG: ribosome maturation factor RimM [Ignavibacteriales bacterium]|nr:ribosome maturation factor RimM [Ignavibacteriales bacterium]MCF8305329.1 ribosome maturation factor RimM [Ignavibacteriales bacterium]MCF8436514.1 ribosome maturation factor RimM [Ignavibacteriales bacterium]
MHDYVLIAEIKSFRKDLFFLLLSYSDFPERFRYLKTVFIELYGQFTEIGVEKVSVEKNNVYLKLAGFNSVSLAESIKGKKLYVKETDSVKLEKDAYFIHDLIGSLVYRNEEKLGVIIDVLSYPANDVYVVKDDGGNEILLPAIRDLIQEFDPGKKVMILFPGDDDLYDED